MFKNIHAETFSMLQPDAITGFTKKQVKKVTADQFNSLIKNQI